MDRLEKSGVDNEGFIKTVFPFDDDQKGLLLNIIQYAVLAIIPIVVLLKLIKNYIPEVDDDKGSLVIVVEVIGQITTMFMALYFIHKIIAYIPTYSSKTYGDVNIINVIPAILLISVTMQTKLGEKVQILIDRLMELYEGQSAPQKGGNSGQVRVTQPISEQFGSPPPPQAMAPPPAQMTNTKAQSHEFTIPQTPNFDNMYAGPETPLVNANVPGGGMMEPMAANDVLGGSFGSSF